MLLAKESVVTDKSELAIDKSKLLFSMLVMLSVRELLESDKSELVLDKSVLDDPKSLMLLDKLRMLSVKELMIPNH